MPKFGNNSKDRLATCDYRLQAICNIAIRHFDFSVLYGHRGEKKQNDLFKKGHSKVRFPNSMHNKYPSMGVDLAPYPIDFKDRERFTYLAGLIMGIACVLGYPLRWGGDWDGDTDLKDNSFDDLGHFELKI